ncbi:4-coumarate--CoA ligase-like 2 [Portunus trituberculatus]|uniref:4-coumarate--CoA ligase-like 2 n=2 Tax=Portunus trituberculatus TaxID=210409 RepID=A0A5B7H9G0_PORTR|nr:4-coumarate--CoA ligase-like 2 [Portunus trituberculatus]
MTETLGSHMTPLDDERLGYCGKVVPNVMAKVINAEGEALPEGERGELCIKTPSVMTGYYKNPKVTAQTIDSEGWLHTGDVAIHTDGFFSIVDRLKELIKVKGFQVSPSELEDVLLEHEGVADVAVIGVPDDRAGELPRAYIVRSSSSCSEEDIHKFMKERAAEFKQLKGGVRFLDALPKNQTGKILKRELQEIAAKEG